MYKVLKLFIDYSNIVYVYWIMKNRYQTSFMIDKELWIKFKSKSSSEGKSIKDKLNSLITDYVNNNKETKNASSWFLLPRWK